MFSLYVESKKIKQTKQNENRLIDTENKLVVTRLGSGGADEEGR